MSLAAYSVARTGVSAANKGPVKSRAVSLVLAGDASGLGVRRSPFAVPGSLFTGQKPPKHADRRRNEIPFRYGEPVSW
jgi:hypothetical protein